MLFFKKRNKKLHKLDQEIETKEQQLSKLKQELKDTDSQLEQKIQELTETINIKQEKLKQIDEELESANNAKVKELENIEIILESANKDKQEKLKQIDEELESANNAKVKELENIEIILESANKDKQEKLKQIDEELESANNAKVKELENIEIILESANKDKQEKLKQIDEEINNLRQDKLKQLNEELESTNAEKNKEVEQINLTLENTKQEKLRQINEELMAKQDELAKIIEAYNQNVNDYKDFNEIIKKNEKYVEELKKEAKSIEELKNNVDNLRQEKLELDEKIGKMQDLKEELDLYSRLDNLKSYGMFERPEYLFETSIRYEEQIRQVRVKQEDLIIKNLAVDIDDMVKNEAVTDFQIKALNDYIKMIIRAFNIECDFLINKVSVSSYAKTLKRISAISFELENLAQAFGLVFNEEFIKLKLLECQLVYEYRFKKKEEKEYLALERQKIRDEKQAQRDYEREIEEANFDEEKYQNLLMQTKKELELSKDKEILEIKILKLEALLKEAEERKQRAISMAQITKKGFIYIISNLGSFGENVYKIGMTRRLDPMDRVIELGDASVPFRFDVHAIIECDNAPQLEYDLHNFLSHKRVNAINLRKEFFRVSIEEIEQALDEILGKNNYDLKKDIKAEEYYQTQRML